MFRSVKNFVMPFSTNTPSISLGETMVYLIVVLLSMAGNSSMAAKPIIIGSYVEYFGFSSQQAGYILTCEMTAAALGAIISTLRVHCWNRRMMALMAIAAILCGNILSIQTDELIKLSLARSLTGAGHGVILAVMSATIAAVSAPDRAAGVSTIFASLLGAAMMLGIPVLQHSLGVSPLFWVMAIIALSPLLFLKWLPSFHLQGTAASINKSQKQDASPISFVAIISIFSATFYYIGIGGFWPFAEQIGRSVGLDYVSASRIVGYATLISIFGGATVVVLGNRFGRKIPIALCLIVQTIGLVLLITAPSVDVFKVVLITYVYSWAVFFPYLMGFIAEIDPSGRSNGLVYTSALIGFAIGPALASYLVSFGALDSEVALDNVLIMNIACFSPVLLLLYVIRKRELRQGL